MKKLNMQNSVALTAESIQHLQSLKPVIDKVRGISKTGVNEYLALIDGENPVLRVLVVVDAGAIFEDTIPVGTVVMKSGKAKDKLGFHLDLEALLNSMSFLKTSCQLLWDENHWAIKEDCSNDYIKGTLNETPFDDETLDDLLNRFETSSKMNYVDRFTFTFDDITEKAFDSANVIRSMQPTCNGIWISKTKEALECQGLPYGAYKLKGDIELEETEEGIVGKCVPFHTQAGDIFRQIRTLKAVDKLDMEVFTLDNSNNPVCNYIARIGELKILIQSQPSSAAYLPLDKKAFTPVNACQIRLAATEVLPVLGMFNSIIPKASWSNGVVMISIDPTTYSENDKTVEVAFSFEGTEVNLRQTVLATDVENIEALKDKEAMFFVVFELLKVFMGKKDDVIMSFDGEGVPSEDEYQNDLEAANHKLCIYFENSVSSGLACKFEF